MGFRSAEGHKSACRYYNLVQAPRIRQCGPLKRGCGNPPILSMIVLEANQRLAIRTSPAWESSVLASVEDHTPLTVIKNVCPLDCPDTCSMRVTVKDGVAIELRGDPDHRFTQGFLCQKMARYLDRVYSPDRLLQPMKRIGRKGEGKFEPIDWDEALDTIARKFAAIARSSDGPQAILPYSYYGTMGKLQASSLDRRFFHRLGASMLDRTICASAGSAGYEYTVGRGRFGTDPLAVPRCKFIVNWGSNTANTNSHLWSLMIEARKAGATIVTVDPYREPDRPAVPTGSFSRAPAPTPRSH